MRALRVHRFGGPDAVVVETIAEPVLGPNEVLVRVAAAGIGPWDAWVRSGKSVLPQPLPLTLGSDLSGTVVALGSAVRDLDVGAEVFGVTNARFVGAQAELAAAEAGRIAVKPRALSHVQAASAPVVAVTAMQMLFDHAHVRAGQRVLVHGGSGNVGGYAVQLARRAGAYVIASEATADDRGALALGANEVIATRDGSLEALAPVDVVIDTVGGEVQARSLSRLASGGVLISSVSQPASPPRGTSASFILVDVTAAALRELAKMFDAGELEPRPTTEFALADARAVHEMLDGARPRPRGKMVFSIPT